MYPMRCEWTVNWRIAKMGFKVPESLIMFEGDRELFTDSQLIVFIPQNADFNIIALRDWLHDTDNNAEGYQMIGCFETSANYRTRMVGLKFSFNCEIDAIFFYLNWSKVTPCRT